jgi:pyruvate kinase
MHAEHGPALCEAAVTLAERAHAVAIVAVTLGGNTARMLAALRPSVQIFAATHRPEVARRLMLYRGVTPLVTELGESVDATGQSVGRQLIARGLLEPDDDVVFVSVHEDLSRPASNFLKLHRVG